MKNKKLSILIADDDQDDQEFIKMGLKEVSYDFQLSSVYNGLQLLDFIFRENSYKNIEERVDVIILDLNMPKMNGWEVLSRFREDARLREIPIVIFSTSNFDWEMIKALELGAVRFFTKPNDPVTYKEIMTEICDLCLATESKNV